MKGYVRLRSKVDGTWYPSIHKKCDLEIFKGIAINTAMHLEDGDKNWADQLSIYSWLLGEPIGSEEIIFGIDQVCGPRESLRFATHRLRVTPEYQYNLFELIKDIWRSIQEGRIFKDLTVEENIRRCELLEARAKLIVEGGREQMEIGGLSEPSKKDFAAIT